jgi:ATP-dependent Clp protease ATP-binding subunit ClpA
VSDGPERLTPRVRRVLAMAEDEAVGLRQAEVGTEHVLIALLREGRGLATRTLRELGVEPADLAQRIRQGLVPAQIGADGPIGLGPGARGALDMARAEAARLHHDYVGTEHLLLGLLRDGEGPAFVVLNGAGITLGRVRAHVTKFLNESVSEPPKSKSGGMAELRGRRRPVDRLVDLDPRDGGDDGERCGRCGRTRRSDWRYCAFCGERWPACDRCAAPIPGIMGVRFCPGCGVMVQADERV